MSILQGIYIMEKIGIPNDNLQYVLAGKLKAIILVEKALKLMKYFVTSTGLYDI